MTVDKETFQKRVDEVKREMRTALDRRVMAIIEWLPDGSVMIVSPFGTYTFGPEQSKPLAQLYAYPGELPRPK